jgi:hypothetical protein
MVMHPAERGRPRRWELASSREQQQWRGLSPWRQRLAYLAAFLLVYGALEVRRSLHLSQPPPDPSHKSPASAALVLPAQQSNSGSVARKLCDVFIALAASSSATKMTGRCLDVCRVTVSTSFADKGALCCAGVSQQRHTRGGR